MGRQAVDMTGMRFGRLVCVSPTHSTKSGMYWDCVCDCGKMTNVIRGNLLTGSVSSCGCLWQESRAANGRKARTTHGRTRRDVDGNKVNRIGTYSTWEAMHSRCYNPKSSYYHRYGGRGIKVCDSWHDFENFLIDMGERPEGMTLDRKNPNGMYEPDNCRWATAKEQSNNKA